MITSSKGTRVPDTERLARFILFRNRVRPDGTVKPVVWMPPDNLELSVTRHASLPGRAIWSRGHDLACTVGRGLVGRADVTTGEVRSPDSPEIDVVEWPIEPENPEHAHVVGWPPTTEKPRQMIIATRIAAASVFVRAPESSAP